MSMISNDRWPDVPMSTQGNNSWHDQTLGPQIDGPLDSIGTAQNYLEIGPDGKGFSFGKARTDGRGNHYRIENPDVMGAGNAAGRP